MISWDVEPAIVTLGAFSLRWYSLAFLTSFIFGYVFLLNCYKKELKGPELVDSLLTYMMFGTIIGARLGHCLFYEPEVYLADPIRILKVWEGGLASHGAAIGILTASFLYCLRNKGIKYLWLVDRIVIPVALAGALIRLGNLMNSEIIGKPTDVAWAFVFKKVDEIPRHPAQIYESFTYFIIFFILLFGFKKKNFGELPGKLLGSFLVLIFGSRIFLEFFKEHQVAFESQLPLDMGQLLSIPAVLIGVWLVLSAKSRKPSNILSA